MSQLRQLVLAIAVMLGCKSGSDTNTKANQRPEQDEGPPRPASGSLPPAGGLTGDRSGADDGGAADGSGTMHDAGAGDGRTKAETPFDDESSAPPPDAR